MVAFAILAATALSLSAQTSLAFAPSSLSHVQLKSTSTTTTTSLNLGDFFNFGKKEEEIESEDTTATTTEEESSDNDEGYYDEDDPIEKVFGFFFGKKEKEPMGMARIGAEKFPELYPATLDEWADPLEGDNAEMALLRPLLKNTNMETRNLRLTYDANKDGWDPTIFHSKVDKQGGAIVYITTRDGITCGGYNPKGWVGYGEARGSIAAFLFILGGGFADASTGRPGIKLQKVGGPGLAQMDMPETGPQFSPDGLVIPMDRGNQKLARSKLGSYYERLPDGTNSLFGKDANVQLKELKVYHGVYAEGEYVPFTDAEPFALY